MNKRFCFWDGKKHPSLASTEYPVTFASEAACVVNCVKTPSCEAFNYNKDNRRCEIGTAEQALAFSHLEVAEGVVHYSSLLCDEE